MRRLVLYGIVIVLVLGLAGVIAGASLSVVIDATQTTATYTFSFDPPKFFKVTPSGLVVNSSAQSDNIKLDFKTSSGQEVVILYFKKSGTVAIESPYLGVSPGVEVTAWNNDVPLYLYFYEDKIILLDSNKQELYTISGTVPSIAQLYVATDQGDKVFTAGSITVEEIQDYSIYIGSAITTIQSLLPTILSLMLVIGVMSAVMGMFKKFF